RWRRRSCLVLLVTTAHLRLEQATNRAVVEPELTQTRHGSSHRRAPALDGRRVTPNARRDECAGPVPELDEPFVLHLAVSLRHCIRVHDELACQLADPRQLIARGQRAELDRVPNLLDELQVERDTGLRVRLEHCRQYYICSTV